MNRAFDNCGRRLFTTLASDRGDCAVKLRRPAVGRLVPIAFLASEHGTEHAAAALRCNDPRPVRPGRVMTHVLEMAAVELRDPIPFFVLVIVDDLAVHGSWAYRPAYPTSST